MRTILSASALCLLALASPLAQQAPQAPQAPSAPPGTDIYLVPMSGGAASLKGGKPTPVSKQAGYENQPNFSPDGNRILFAANADGGQTDVFAFDRNTGNVTRMTRTRENENSPTFVPPGAGPAGSFGVVQSEFDKNGNRPTPAIQRLWRFDGDSKPSLILPNIDPVGYHAWIDNDRLVLFVLGAQGKPATLQIASVKTGKGEVVADGPGRSLHKIPGTTGLASFVQRDGEDYWVKQIDITSKKIDPIVKAVAGSADRDMTWMPDGKTMLMSAGTKIYSWTRGAAGWTEVFDAAAHQLGTVSRLAVSPKGDALAIVVSEPVKK